MLKRRLLLVISLVALCLSAAPARAGLSLSFDIDDTEMTYTTGDGKATVRETDSSILEGSLYSGSTKTDSAYILSASNFDALLDLQFSGGGSSWSAAGSLAVTDSSLSNRFEADFASTAITLTQVGTNYFLTVQGTLATQAGNDAILVNSDPWTFAGTSQDSGVGNGSDTVANTITIAGWDAWDSGDLFTIHWDVGTISNLDTLFGSDRTLSNGQMVFTVVPVPAAVLIGMLGLGVAGLKLRKYV